MSDPPGEPWLFCVSSVKSEESAEENMSSWDGALGAGSVMRDGSIGLGVRACWCGGGKGNRVERGKQGRRRDSGVRKTL
jgi:hypothetical protein